MSEQHTAQTSTLRSSAATEAGRAISPADASEPSIALYDSSESTVDEAGTVPASGSPFGAALGLRAVAGAAVGAGAEPSSVGAERSTECVFCCAGGRRDDPQRGVLRGGRPGVGGGGGPHGAAPLWRNGEGGPDVGYGEIGYLFC